MANLNISDEYFGKLLPLVKDELVTDITWNGKDLWIDHLEKGRFKSDIKLTDSFVSTFSTRLANLANKNFNMSEPLLEAETDELRISVVDGTVTNTERSIAIRKTPAVRRLNEAKMLKDGYAEEDVLKLLELFVKGHCSCIVTGDVGSGKTELVKYLTKFIPNEERTISIEDNFELRLSSINPDLDAVEIKATNRFDYSHAIKAALRQLCKWLLLSEARSTEVVQLLEAASTGCIVMTTIHSDDVRKLPDRIVNMMGLAGEEKRNDVYNFFDVGIKINIRKTQAGIERRIAQIAVMDRADEENTLTVIYDDGFTGEPIPYNIWKKIMFNASDDMKELFAFLKPKDAEEKENRQTAAALNAKITDKGRLPGGQPGIVTVNISKEDIKTAIEENKSEEPQREVSNKSSKEDKFIKEKSFSKNSHKTVHENLSEPDFFIPEPEVYTLDELAQNSTSKKRKRKRKRKPSASKEVYNASIMQASNVPLLTSGKCTVSKKDLYIERITKAINLFEYASNKNIVIPIEMKESIARKFDIPLTERNE